MVAKFWRSKWFIALSAVIIAVSLTFIALRIDYSRREDEDLEYFSKQEGMPDAFAKLEELTPPGSVILCWWDYGRAVREWSHREVIEAYPSREIWYTLGISRDPLHIFEAQIFGRWGSHEKIRDIATMFMLSEQQSLELMRQYDVAYVLVFVPDELQKYYWMAHIAGYNATDYLIYSDNQYQPTPLGCQTTLLKLIFDEELRPTYFTKMYDNGKGKIYRVNYPSS